MLSDPVLTTRRLYKEVLLVALKRAEKMYEVKDGPGAIELLKEVIPLAQLALELVDTIMLYKLIAHIELHCKEYDRALDVFHLIAYMCSNKESLALFRLESL